MGRSYNFAVIRLAPPDIKNESINIGIMVCNDARSDIRISRGLDKVRAISAAIDIGSLKAIIEEFPVEAARLLGDGVSDFSDRLRLMSENSLLSFAYGGVFSADNEHVYEARVLSIVKNLVDPEPAPRRAHERRTRLFSQVKRSFQQERVLAKKNEDLSSHRILTGYEIDEGLIADLILRNGALHIVETVDASGDNGYRKAIAEIGVAALVLERARMKFENITTNARLVYNASATMERVVRPSLDAAAHQGSKLTNWASEVERTKFIHELSSLAVPIEDERKKRVLRLPPLLGGSNIH